MLPELQWTTVKRTIKDLVPLSKNPFGKISEDKKKRLEGKIRRLGVFEIPTVDTNNELLSFNKRRHILVALGRESEEIDVRVPNRELTESERKEIILSSNIHEGEWDKVILEEDFADLDLADLGLDMSDIDKEIDNIYEEAEAEEDDFDIPEIIKTDIVIGDLMEIGRHRLLCGSSTEVDTWKKLMKGKLADLVVTDPPYNVDYKGGTGMTIMNDKQSNNQFYQFLYDFYTSANSFVKPGGSWYVWHADSEGLNFRKAFIDSGIMLKQCLIWVKNSLVLGRQDYQWKHEPCLYGWNPGASHYFTPDRSNATVIDDQTDYNKLKKEDLVKILKDRDEHHTSILRFNKPAKNDVHPTMKPIPLIAELIKNSSIQDQVVIDGFLGSGSTMVASHQLNRSCYGIELDPKYCQVIIERMLKLDPEIEVKRNGEVWKVA